MNFHKYSDREMDIATELASKALERTDVFMGGEDGSDMKAYGSKVAELFNAIIENLNVRNQ